MRAKGKISFADLRRMVRQWRESVCPMPGILVDAPSGLVKFPWRDGAVEQYKMDVPVACRGVRERTGAFGDNSEPTKQQHEWIRRLRSVLSEVKRRRKSAISANMNEYEINAVSVGDKNGDPIVLGDQCAIDEYPSSRRGGGYVYRFVFDRQTLAFVLHCKESRHTFRAWRWSDDLLRIMNVEKIDET